MKLCIPTSEGRLCGHFGHCDSFTIAEVDPVKKEIINVEEKVPEEGISCQSTNWIASQGVSKVLAGGMGARPMMSFMQNGIEVVAGCPELPIREILEKYLSNTLESGENSCGSEGGEHHHCHHHLEGHSCHRN